MERTGNAQAPYGNRVAIEPPETHGGHDGMGSSPGLGLYQRWVFVKVGSTLMKPTTRFTFRFKIHD